MTKKRVGMTRREWNDKEESGNKEKTTKNIK